MQRAGDWFINRCMASGRQSEIGRETELRPREPEEEAQDDGEGEAGGCWGNPPTVLVAVLKKISAERKIQLIIVN